MTAHTHPVVRAYLARVRTALSDLPAAEIDEIVEDVRPHLAEIVESLGDRASVAAMTGELGEPESYAAEVRAAGEYPPAPNEEAPTGERPFNRFFGRVALWGVVVGVVLAGWSGAALGASLDGDALVPLLAVAVLVGAAVVYLGVFGTTGVRELPEVRRFARTSSVFGAVSRVGGWFRALNPVWWVLSALFLVLLAVIAMATPYSSVFVFVVLLALGALALWVGPRSARDHRMAVVAVPLSVFVLGAGLGTADYVLQAARDSGAYQYGYTHAAENVDGDGEPALYYGSRQVENLYVFDSEGKPLTDVYIYDEDGSPLLVPRYGCDEHAQTKIRTGKDNNFPHPHIEQGGYDEFGTVNGYNISEPFCDEVDEVPFTVAVPGGK